MNVRPHFNPGTPVDGALSGQPEARPEAELKFYRLVRSILSWQGNPLYRHRRYALVLLPPLVLVWLAVTAYCMLWPETFRSEMVLNLPGAGANASINLSNIGQTSTSANTPFGDRSLSPKIIYREIAQSTRVRGMAARRLGIPFASFPAPRIMLVDQTALMTLVMDAPTPEAAQQYNEALLAELSAQLDVLRRDEIGLECVPECATGHMKVSR